MKDKYKKYKKHGKLIHLPNDFHALKDLAFTVFEDVEIENRGFVYNLTVPYLKTKSSYFNLGYLNSSYIPEENFHMAWNEKHSLGLNEKNKDGFINYHVDKPFIDFIEVFEPYQRKGIAEAMILYTAKWYAQHGLKFYFSNLNGHGMELLKSNMIEKYDFILCEKNDDNYNRKVRHYFDFTN